MLLPRFTWQDSRRIFVKQRLLHARASIADARRRSWTRSSAKRIGRNEQKFSRPNHRSKTRGDSADPRRSFYQPFSRTRIGDSEDRCTASAGKSVELPIAAAENYRGIQA